MGSKGINFTRTLSGSSWDFAQPQSETTTTDSPVNLRATARKIEASIDSLQEQYSEYIHQLKDAESITSSQLPTEITFALDDVCFSFII